MPYDYADDPFVDENATEDLSFSTIAGTEVYNINTFNEYFKKVADFVNPINNNVATLLSKIDKRLPYITEQTNVNTMLSNGIYFNVLTSEGLQTNCILISIQNNNTSIQTMLTADNNIKQRTVTPALVSDWVSLTYDIADNLTTQDSKQVLSANQGYVLNRDKLDRTEITTKINIDTDIKNSGIYVCNAGITTTRTTLQLSENIILTQYGETEKGTATQILYDNKYQTCFISYYYYDKETEVSQWSDFILLGSSGGSNISLSMSIYDDF